MSLPTIQVKTDVRDIAADDAETDSSGHEPRPVPAGEPSAEATGWYRLRLSGEVLPVTEAVSRAFFAKPIKPHPAGVHTLFR